MRPMTPDAILGLARSFMESRILLSAVELDLFTLLAGAPLTARKAADALGSDPRGTTVLLDALAALGVLEKRDGAYHCGFETASLLSREAPGSLHPMLMHSVALWRRWSELTEVVLRGTPAQRAAPEQRETEREAFIGAMHTIGSRMAEEVVAAVRPGPARRLLDIGGASGSYTEAFLAASPAMRATLFDLPPVVEIARRRLQGSSVLDRVTLVAGDFSTDELPGGHDLALLSAIIHQNSAEQNVDIYRKVHRALKPGGRLVIRDHVMSPDHTQPARGAIFAVNMLVGTEGGGTYSFAEIRSGLEAAGFTRVSLLQPDERMSGLVEGFTQG
jgi:predicted O-methyltransferase YrrM